MYICIYTYIYKVHIIMANYSGKLIKFVYDKWDNHKILKSANRIIEKAKGKAQEHFNNNIIKSNVLQELRTIPLEPINPLPKRLINWWQWYQYVVGLSTVEKARQQVILLQNKLTNCREIRRVLRQEAFINNNKIKEIYEELLRTKRDDPKYVTLTILENKTLQEQSKNVEHLNLLEEEEKDYFAQLSSAINEYQDAQALNAQKYKYISILASAIAALLSLISSMIYNSRRINNIKQSISEMQKKNEVLIVNHCNSLEESINKKLTNLEENLIGKSTKTWTGIGRTIGIAPQTKTVYETPQNKAEDGWLNLAKKTAYVFSVLLMIKGIMF